MAVSVKVLHEGITIATAPSNTTVYTTPASTSTIIDKCTIQSFHTTTSVVTIYLVEAGGSVSSPYAVLKKILVPNEAYICPEIVGHTLAAGDFIVATSSTNATSIRASGREVT